MSWTTDEIETDAAGGSDSDTPESELTKAARSTWAGLINKFSIFFQVIVISIKKMGEFILPQ